MILTSLLTGGLTGVLGSLFTNVADIWKRHQDRKHEIDLKKLDLEAMDKEWEYRARQTEVEGEIRLRESADDLREASYANDAIRYATGVKIKSAWLSALLVMVDVVRGLIRPALTVYLIWLVWNTRAEVRAVIDAAGGVQAMDVTTAVQTYRSIIEMILYLAATCVTWWFGTRPIQRGK
jgi:hypothetical protein